MATKGTSTKAVAETSRTKPREQLTRDTGPKVKGELAIATFEQILERSLSGAKRAEILSDLGPSTNLRVVAKCQASVNVTGHVNPDVVAADKAIVTAMMLKANATESEVEALFRKYEGRVEKLRHERAAAAVAKSAMASASKAAKKTTARKSKSTARATA